MTLLFQVSRTPSLAQIKHDFKASDRALLDRQGQVLDGVRAEKSARRLNWISLADVPSSFLNAVLSSEDRRFFYHPGLDPLSLLNKQSSLTLQLVQLIERDKVRNANVSWLRFQREPLLSLLDRYSKALAFELAWSKRDILEAYINLVRYRRELQGLNAAAFGLFEKPPRVLNLREASVLAALIRLPEAGAHEVRARACEILAQMRAPEECALLTPEHLSYLERAYRIRPYIRLAPHVMQRLANEPKLTSLGLVRTTLDRELQWTAIHALQKQNSIDGAVIVVENSSGHVLAYVSASAADAATDPRAAGSMLRPLIFAKALDERVLTVATALEGDFGEVDRSDMRVALRGGLEIPVLRTLERLGAETFVKSMQDLGFTDLQSPEAYGPSLALGSAPVKLSDLANAYRALANNGIWTPLRFSPDVPSEFGARRVFSPAAAFIIKDILSNENHNLWSMVKHGLPATDNRDTWSIGFSDRYTIGVSGPHNAAIWQELLSYLHRRQPSESPRLPEGLIREISGQREEWFLSGTQPSLTSTADTTKRRSSISYPKNNAIIALDLESSSRPDHRLLIQIAAPQGDQNVYLNGRRLGRAEPFLKWEPESGLYTLELRDSKGLLVDKVRFEVRGRRFALAGQKPGK
ncbi:MAG: transglycosylase domain-containing protein [Bdellovibrionales bacterium]|nr:transglycosylase domain-containing protein [Bdellovibrionales bacterium]